MIRYLSLRCPICNTTNFIYPSSTHFHCDNCNLSIENYRELLRIGKDRLFSTDGIIDFYRFRLKYIHSKNIIPYFNVLVSFSGFMCEKDENDKLIYRKYPSEDIFQELSERLLDSSQSCVKYKDVVKTIFDDLFSKAWIPVPKKYNWKLTFKKFQPFYQNFYELPESFFLGL